jgi:FSR family fosmidomycin resistance protein-like MFS transporter
MFNRLPIPTDRKPATVFLRALSLTLIFLLIEFFDELHYAIGNTALPAMRAELGLTYAQVGLLLGLPQILNIIFEPVIMLLGDSQLRKRLVMAGGGAIFVTLLMIAGASSFPWLIAAYIIAYPASGAFVTLSQATLMDTNPGREP